MGENDKPVDESVQNSQDFWQTAHGRFHIRIEELPDQLQLVYHILKVNIKKKYNYIIYMYNLYLKTKKSRSGW